MGFIKQKKVRKSAKNRALEKVQGPLGKIKSENYEFWVDRVE